MRKLRVRNLREGDTFQRQIALPIRYVSGSNVITIGYASPLAIGAANTHQEFIFSACQEFEGITDEVLKGCLHYPGFGDVHGRITDVTGVTIKTSFNGNIPLSKLKGSPPGNGNRQ